MSSDPVHRQTILCRQFAAFSLSHNVSFLMVAETDLSGVSPLSATECALAELRFPGAPEERIRWLQSCPPHFDALYGELADYSPSYVREIFHPVENVATRRGRMNRDHRSRFVNVIGGYRHTTGQPACWDHALFVVGNSGVYGMGCEDRHTLPSQLQELANIQGERLGGSYAVFNLGARGQQTDQCFATLLSLECKPGDVVVLHGLPYSVIGALSEDPALTPHTLVPDFSRRAPNSELFFDFGHVAHKGQQLIAAQIFERLATLAEMRSTLQPPSESGLRDALAALREACPLVGTASDVRTEDLELERFIEEVKVRARPATLRGAVVVNANPFTLGHQYLLEYAARRVDQLFVFVVEEDRSLFDFATRLALVRAGTAHLENVTVSRSGRFIMSAETCPEYFSKEEAPHVVVDGSRDLNLFGEVIAPALGISLRFIGEEPDCAITAQHNRQMQSRLPTFGIRVEEVPRLRIADVVVSASEVRRAVREGRWSTSLAWVPATTAAHLRERFGAAGDAR